MCMLKFLMSRRSHRSSISKNFNKTILLKKQHTYLLVLQEHPSEVLHLEKYRSSLFYKQKSIFASNKTPQRLRVCAKILLKGKESRLCPVYGWIGNRDECASKIVSLLTVLFSVKIYEYPKIDTLDRLFGRQFNGMAFRKCLICGNDKRTLIQTYCYLSIVSFLHV